MTGTERRVYAIELPMFAPPRPKRKPNGQGINPLRPPKPAPYNQNWQRKLHWRPQHEMSSEIVKAVMLQARSQRIPKVDHLTVQLHYATGDNTSVDPDNLTPSLKAAVDALARPVRNAGRGKQWKGLHLVPDDTQEYVTRLPSIVHTGPGQARRLWLEVQLGRP